MLHGLEATDHRLHARAHLLVLLQEPGAIIGEGLMPLTQCPILLLESLDACQQLFDALFQPRELEVELRSCCVVHAKDYGARLFARSMESRPREALQKPRKQ